MATGRFGSLNSQVASEIRAMMARRGISGMRLARILGVSQPWVSTRLVGATAITINDVERIAEALGVRALDLFPRAAERTSDAVLATIGFDRPRRPGPRLRRVTEEYSPRPRDNRPSNAPGVSPTPRRTVRSAA